MFHDQVPLSLVQSQRDLFADGDLPAMLGCKPKDHLPSAPFLSHYLAFPGAKIRRTEVRPIRSGRAISALLMPARCSTRTSVASVAAVIGRPRRLPFWRAWARPARVRSLRIFFSNLANIA